MSYRKNDNDSTVSFVGLNILETTPMTCTGSVVMINTNDVASISATNADDLSVEAGWTLPLPWDLALNDLCNNMFLIVTEFKIT